ncbi:hypothetical protein ACI8AG_19145 [Blastococcus sp. SYSU DS0552]
MTAPERRTGRQRLRYLGTRAVQLEVGVWQSLSRFVLRRPRVPAGVTAFPYHRVVLPVIITFIVVSAIELVAVDVLTQHWPLVRYPLLALGIWGLVWMFGYLAGLVTRPHAVGPEGITVRFSTDVDLQVPWDVIGSVARRSRTRPEKAPRFARGDDGAATLQLWMHDQTNVDIVLDRPVVVRLPELTGEVRAVRLFADDPVAFLAEVRRQRPSVAGPPGRAPRTA